MLLQNITLFAQYPIRRVGGSTTATDGMSVRSQLGIRSVSQLAPFVSMAGWSRESSFPPGWEFGNGWLPPIREQTVWNANLGRSDLSGSGDLDSASNLAGGLNAIALLTGTGSIVSAAGALIVSAIATLLGAGGFATANARGRLDAVAALSGTGSILSAPLGAIAGAIATLIGSGAVSVAAGSAIGSASATITVTGDLLTSANVGPAVWNALATASNIPGTMGEKLNLASAGGVDYGALATAVWEASIGDYTGETMTGYRLAKCGWDIALPGAFGSGDAGYILGNLSVTMPEAVWGADAASNNTPGTMGELANAPPLDYDQISLNVWETDPSSYTDPDTMGGLQNLGVTDYDQVAASVWEINSGFVNVPGTTGEKINAAGSAGNPWTEVLEGGKTAAELMRLILAATAGKCEVVDNGGGSFSITFRDMADSMDRIVGVAHTDGSRDQPTTLDGSDV